jgi:hypothetical protein
MNQIVISEEQLEKLPGEELVALVKLLFAEIERLNARIAELEAQLSSHPPPATSRNSSQPPSRDQKANLGEKKSQKRVGAKPGHKAAVRPLADPQGLRMVAVLPEKQEEAASYLKEHGIGVDEVISMKVSKLGVRGTPTLLLLDGQNKLEELWAGKLNESQEGQVIERLKKACSGCALSKTAMKPAVTRSS